MGSGALHRPLRIDQPMGYGTHHQARHLPLERSTSWAASQMKPEQFREVRLTESSPGIRSSQIAPLPYVPDDVRRRGK
jgi:hypothetical protein